MNVEFTKRIMEGERDTAEKKEYNGVKEITFFKGALILTFEPYDGQELEKKVIDGEELLLMTVTQ